MEGQLSDEWVFILPDKKQVKQARGPVRKAHLAFFLDEDALSRKVLVHHVTHGIAEARRVADYVEDWKAESIQSAGGSRLACMTLLWHQGSLHSLALSCLADLYWHALLLCLRLSSGLQVMRSCTQKSGQRS